MPKNKKKRRKTSPPKRATRQIYSNNEIKQQLAQAGKFLEQKEFNRASQIVEKILLKDPEHPLALGMQGEIFYHQGDFDKAIDWQQKAVKKGPNDPALYFNLGVFLGECDRFEEALDAYRQTLQAAPNYINAHINIGIILHKRRDLDGAIATHKKALKIKPDFGLAYLNLGEFYTDKGDFKQAIEAYEKGIALLPNSPKNLNNLGILYRQTQQENKAINVLQKALDLDPTLIASYTNLATVYMEQGRLNKAFNNFRKALDPENVHFPAITNYLLCLNYSADHSVTEVSEEHRKWGGIIEQKAESLRRNHDKPIHTDRRIKIGYVSSDFRRHAVANFIAPILAAHNRQLFEVVCYYNGPHPDELTLEFQKMADKWRDIFRLNDSEIASLIQNDQIDILMDLVGHTANSRLEALAMKPAPIQVTYLGYPNTTGLQTVDYRLTDHHADPVGQTEHLHTETLARLPDCFLCYKSTVDRLTINDLPMQSNGYVTFTSLNNRPKINDRVVSCWSQILKKVPNSKLLLKSVHLSDEKDKNYLRSKFIEQGIDEKRIDILGATQSFTDHLKVYNKADIALDTFPYNGTTTTFEALWMGVPVITLKGASHVSRVGTSILNQIDLENCIAGSEEKYITLAVALAKDPEQLAILRKTLRSRLTASPACDAERFTRNLENIYQEMVATWNRQFPDVGDTDHEVCSSSEEYSRLGEQLFKANQFEEARAALEKAIELNPNNEVALNNLGVLLWQGGDLQGAMAFFQQALAAKPDYVNAIDNLTALLDSAGNKPPVQPQSLPITANQSLSTNPLVQFGEELLAQKKFVEAAQAFEKAIQTDPTDDIAYNNLGIVHWQTGNHQEAIKSFSTAIKLNPNAQSAISNMKALLHQVQGNGQGKIHSAIPENTIDTQSFIQTEQAGEDELLEKGEELFGSGDISSARSLFEQVLAHNPVNTTAHNNLGVLYWHTGEIYKSEQSFKTALAFAPQDESALHNLQELIKGQPEIFTSENYEKPAVSILHHMARSGGTVISKCIGCMNDIVLLSEIHPLGTKWFEPLSQATAWFQLFTQEEFEELKNKDLSFIEAIINIDEKCRQQGKHLVIRDWTHLDYPGVPFLPRPTNQLFTHELLRGHCDIHRYTTVRHPLDQWLSLSSLEIMQGHLSLADFLAEFRKFAESCREIGFIRYEDFVEKPDEKTRSLCERLKIPFDPDFVNKWWSYETISGDTSGPSKDRRDISPKPPRNYPAELLTQCELDANYQESLKILGYEHPVSRKPVTKKTLKSRSKLPTVIASSVIRSAHQGESHGGVYIIDLEREKFKQVIDWNDPSISWEGRGADRGLRGIAFYDDNIYLAASDEIFIYDQRFNIIESIKNPYLKHAHEICIHNDVLAITSTGYDSILLYNLKTKKFEKSYALQAKEKNKFEFSLFDPTSEGPAQGDTLHINSVSYANGAFHFSALRLPHLYKLSGDTLTVAAHIPVGTHNSQLFQKGVIVNNTENNCVTVFDDKGNTASSYTIVHYNEEELLMKNLPADHARQRFARGLCFADDLIIAGSSPATISVYVSGQSTPVKSINLTLDVRNAIHGLEIWPFPTKHIFT